MSDFDGCKHGLTLEACDTCQLSLVRSQVATLTAERDEARGWAKRLLGLVARFVSMTPRSLNLGRLPFAELHDEASDLIRRCPPEPVGTRR